MRHAEGIRREWQNRDADWSRDPDARSDRDELLCRAGLRKATNESTRAPQPALMAQALRMLEVLAQRQYAQFCKATINDEVVSFASAEAKFNALADAWLNYQSGRSRLDFMHPAYQQIVGMGPQAVRFLLREVEQQSGHWFHALKQIAGHSPVPAESRTDFDAVVRAWLEWGRLNGYWPNKDREGQLVDVEPAAPQRR
jgi:hypothetical protein